MLDKSSHAVCSDNKSRLDPGRAGKLRTSSLRCEETQQESFPQGHFNGERQRAKLCFKLHIHLTLLGYVAFKCSFHIK